MDSVTDVELVNEVTAPGLTKSPSPPVPSVIL